MFKIEEKVFDIKYGWGVVCKTFICEQYPITVNFNGFHKTYTNEGCEHVGATATLSFTQYTLEGFSQERKEELEIGKLAYFWFNEKPNIVSCAVLESITLDDSCPYKALGNYVTFKYCSHINPLL